MVLRQKFTQWVFAATFLLKLCIGAPAETTNVYIQNVYQAPPVVIAAYPVPGPVYPVAGDPYPIEQVNHGVSTVLHGVQSGDLSQVLRGSFIFPTDNNVKSVANTVLDSLFGYQHHPYQYRNPY